MKTINQNGFVFQVPDRYYHNNLKDRFLHNNYEKYETLIARKYFNKDDEVLELGTCLGVISSILSSKCNRVVSIEANPELKESLQLTKTHNNLDNVTFLSGYLDCEQKTIEFQTFDNIVAGSGDREDNGKQWVKSLKVYNVDTILLDHIPNFNTLNALFVDIEGGELNFLTIFKEFIVQNIKKICIELHGFIMKDKDYDNKCLTLMREMGFTLKEHHGNSYYLEK